MENIKKEERLAVIYFTLSLGSRKESRQCTSSAQREMRM